MTERIDHVAESEKINELVGENFIAEEGWTETTAILGGIDSLRHATLALVEQQRIANIIALAGLEMNSPLRHLAIRPDGEYSIDVGPEIKTALGLE